MVEPIGLKDAGQLTFDYLRLGDEDFERLSYALAKVSAPCAINRTWDSATLMVRGADAGRDVLLTCCGRAVGVIQCKRLESQLAMPAVFREIAKLILFATVHGDMRFDDKLVYMLAVARDPAGTVSEYFARRAELESVKADDVKAAAREVRDTYKTLNHLSDNEAETVVLNALPALDLYLLRPVDLDEWLEREGAVSRRFFRQRTVVDNEVVQDGIADIKATLADLSKQIAGTAPVTDQDLAILREEIERTPESHRLNVGIAMLFGFPREMFVGRPALEARVGRLAKLLNEITSDYTDWVFVEARRRANEILVSDQAQLVAPFSRQIPQAFLALVAKECLTEAVSGSVMSGIIDKLSNATRLDTDEARLQQVRNDLRTAGLQYLAGDFSKLVGDSKLVAEKRALISLLMHNVENAAHLEGALDHGATILQSKLFAAAHDLRDLCKHKTTIVLTGTRGIDTDASLKRLVDTVRALDSGQTS
ncbi:hypothetical protein [Telmatospirillum sp.]|uniref:hypothetical protein n=1 Tax=Telmatospirillum sp. TaxID=2079197 RepID=UPI00283F504E|nr:hypothetical protein [Telmatospirillum sp.]MDR3439997.1 hypothetical protein [Telmatospirillum sp.]